MGVARVSISDIQSSLAGEAKFMHAWAKRRKDLLIFLDTLLRTYTEEQRRDRLHGGVVGVRPTTRNTVFPGLEILTYEQSEELRPPRELFLPDLVIELLPRGATEVNYGSKFTNYETHGVKEYWILDAEFLTHHFFHRRGSTLVEFAIQEQIVYSEAVPGFWFKRTWLDPENLPPVDECLAEIWTNADKR